jgi:membrane protein YdbS with pleckstrin-like domain
MNKIRKIFSWVIPLCVGLLSPIIYGVIMIFLAGYGFWLAIVTSIVVFVVGVVFLMIDFKGGVRMDTWRSGLGLMLAINPILLLISFLILEPNSYIAF